MIGWAAATGSIGIESIVLFLIIFFWTPPHFWALALLRAGEYSRAGVPMLPVTSGRAETRRQILIYSLLLAPLGVAPCADGICRTGLRRIAAVAGAVFLALALRLLRAGDGPGADAAAKALVRLLDPLSVHAVRGDADRKSRACSVRGSSGRERRTSIDGRRGQRPDGGIVLTEEQIRRRRARSIAIALSLGAMVLLFYVVTIVKLGPGVCAGRCDEDDWIDDGEGRQAG